MRRGGPDAVDCEAASLELQASPIQVVSAMMLSTAQEARNDC